MGKGHDAGNHTAYLDGATVSPRHAGFTLLEMVLALAIFALLGLMANQVLYQSMALEQLSAQRAGRLAQVQHAMSTLERDFLAMVPRTVRAPNGSVQASPDITTDRQGSDAIAFTHNGRINPGNTFPRSTLERVAYRLVAGSVVREFYDYPDMPAGSEPHRRRLLNDVSALRLRYWSQGAWRSEWRRDSAFPHAIEVRLTLKEGTTITRRFLLAEGE